MFEDNHLQQRIIGYLKFIEDRDYGWITHDVGTTNHLQSL